MNKLSCMFCGKLTDTPCMTVNQAKKWCNIKLLKRGDTIKYD